MGQRLNQLFDFGFGLGAYFRCVDVTINDSTPNLGDNLWFLMSIAP
ncbi:hypothetical protein [Nostoc sp.]